MFVTDVKAFVDLLSSASHLCPVDLDNEGHEACKYSDSPLLECRPVERVLYVPGSVPEYEAFDFRASSLFKDVVVSHSMLV